MVWIRSSARPSSSSSALAASVEGNRHCILFLDCPPGQRDPLTAEDVVGLERDPGSEDAALRPAPRHRRRRGRHGRREALGAELGAREPVGSASRRHGRDRRGVEANLVHAELLRDLTDMVRCGAERPARVPL